MRLYALPSCGLLVAGMIFLLLGLIVGIRSIFIIRESGGRVRGYGHAILAIVCSLLPFPVLMISMFMVGSPSSSSGSHYRVPAVEAAPQRASNSAKAFDALVKDPPPLEWFKAKPTTFRLDGPAKVGEDSMKPVDAAHLRELIERAGFHDVHAHQVVRWVVLNMWEKGTDAPIQVWFAELNAELESGQTLRSAPGVFHMKSGRIVMGIRTERPGFGNEIVKRLEELYSVRMENLPAQ